MIPCRVRLWLLWLWNQYFFTSAGGGVGDLGLSATWPMTVSFRLFLLHLYLSWVPSLC
ncbi:hypothetical protein DPMN_073729 [Dreissena polymorpha]|uniref:Uncharacterized protein n=1 Tax=Dreissena polymorpha TaxID=45954 RepID=A0A9D4BZQ9_DREPO|nr:hypothetical protein DPMN_073729 [Dreissena polymorpha]